MTESNIRISARVLNRRPLSKAHHLEILLEHILRSRDFLMMLILGDVFVTEYGSGIELLTQRRQAIHVALMVTRESQREVARTHVDVAPYPIFCPT